MTLTPSNLARIPTLDQGGAPIAWESPTPVGRVPLELTELYPIGCYLGLEAFESRADQSASPAEPPPAGAVLDGDHTAEWTVRQLRATLEWLHGPEASATLLGRGLVGQRSARTGRLRLVLLDGHPMFTVGNDGLPRPTWRGGGLLHALRPFPAMRIIVDPEAIPFVESGRSLFSRHVRGGDSSLVPGSSALLVDDADRLLAVGRLVLAPPEMGRIPRGVAVRVVAHAHRPEGDGPAEEPGEAAPPPPDARDL